MAAHVQVRYFAMLRDLSGKVDETLAIQTGDTPATLYARLAKIYGFPMHLSDLRVAVNDEFSDPAKPLKEHDMIVFIPPVAGG